MSQSTRIPQDQFLRVAMIGTRGVPATYGGFETAIQEIGRRLADRGHSVVVYTRPQTTGYDGREYLGMELVPLPSIRSKALETISHTGLATMHAVTHKRPDAVILFNAANALYLPALRARRIPVVTHVDGLEWRRTKWGANGRQFYRRSESLAVRFSDALIADAEGISDYFREEFGARTELIAYGAPILSDIGATRLPWGLEPGRFHLIVARFEPENHVLEAVTGFANSSAKLPLVVVGSAPFAEQYTKEVMRAAGGDPRIIFLGSVWDQEELDELYFHALTYIHGHSVGGTNPSLLRAMGAGTTAIAYDIGFNREVLGQAGRFFAGSEDIPRLVVEAENNVAEARHRGSLLASRASERYNWDDVAQRYEDLCRAVANGYSNRGLASGRRRSQS